MLARMCLVLGLMAVLAPISVAGEFPPGVWIAEDIGGAGVIDSARSTLSVASDGAVTATGGCNQYRASAIVEGAKISIKPSGSTRQMCSDAAMAQEEKFFSALEAVKGWTLDGSKLRLTDSGGGELVRFSK